MSKDTRKLVSVIIVVAMLWSLAGTMAASRDFTGHWAEKIITDWLENNWVRGYVDGSIKPDRNVSRAEYISMLNRAFNFTAKRDGHKFSDVAAGVWYEEEVLKGLSQGYLSGEGLLKPGENVTRLEVAMLLYKALRLGYTGDVSQVGRFSDAEKVPDELRREISSMIMRGILTGFDDGTLRLNDLVTRAEAMAMISRGLKAWEEVANAAKYEVSESRSVTSIQISGVSYIAVPEEGVTEELYTFTIRDQRGQVMEGARASWSLLEEIEGVSVDPASGVVTVAAETEAESFVLRAVASGNSRVSANKTVSLREPGLSGWVVSAVSGQGLQGIAVTVLDGEDTLFEVETYESGAFEIFGIQPGVYSLRISGEGFVTITGEVTVEAGGLPVLFVLSPVLPEGQIRIVLSWGHSPRDLDSHLLIPNPGGGNIHLYYGNTQFMYEGVLYAELDHDDTSSYGPETMTIYNQTEGTYIYYVYNYSNESPLATSGAKVEVYFGSEKVATYHVPEDLTGRYWNVFELNGSTLVQPD